MAETEAIYADEDVLISRDVILVHDHFIHTRHVHGVSVEHAPDAHRVARIVLSWVQWALLVLLGAMLFFWVLPWAVDVQQHGFGRIGRSISALLAGKASRQTELPSLVIYAAGICFSIWVIAKGFNLARHGTKQHVRMLKHNTSHQSLVLHTSHGRLEVFQAGDVLRGNDGEIDMDSVHARTLIVYMRWPSE